MILYDNNAYREEFMELVYNLLHSDDTNDRANQIIDAFDSAPEVEAELLLPNDPLTLEELQEMDGHPVYILDLLNKESCLTGYIIFHHHTTTAFYPCGRGWFSAASYGATWIAYRRKPEEGDKGEETPK